jgi:cell division septation protein DedD
VKKQTSSGESKILILLVGVVFMALLALGVFWAPRFIRKEAAVAPPPAAKHIKIAQVPSDQTPPAPPVEPARPQQQPSGTPEPEISSASDQPLQESVKPQPAEPAGSGASETPAQEAKTPDAAPAKETSEPAVIASAHDEVTQAQPEEDTPTGTDDAAQAEPETAQPAAAPDAGTAYFSLQVGAFRQKAYALDTMGKLSKKGYDAFVYDVTDSRQRTLHTVRVGRYNSQGEAASALDRLKQKENIDAIITKAVKP